ncbi:MAG: DUF3810 domain-containing protein [Chitinophagaceae bacterium]|nr:MAG: DUF3810 domain-containing protein [Chitinophagaceae bacterium]
MLKTLFRDRFLLLFLIVAVLIKLFSLNEAWVEQYYTFGFYPVISKTLRTLFGWLPVSIGDLVYIWAFIWLVFKTWKLVKLLKQKQAKGHLSWVVFRKYLKLGLLVYIVFSLFWGLNYFRQGIEKQLGLELKPYSVEDLFTLTTVLQQRLNNYAERIDSVQRLQYNKNSLLFEKGKAAYDNIKKTFPYLAYSAASIKPSLFTPVGHWFGFTGYYNPFSAEAQLKTSIPVFLKPFVVTHEIAHQLGYAKENEASFVAFLACKNSMDSNFLYSVYFEMYRDALFACRLSPNKELTETISKNIHPRVRWDIRDLRLYLLRNQNFIEPFMSGAYDRYLKLNNQPKGKATYNEVIAYLVAYMKKFGKGSI